LASPHQHFHLEVLLQSGASFYGPQFVAGTAVVAMVKLKQKYMYISMQITYDLIRTVKFHNYYLLT
jgi:hypothetical protein